MSPRTSLLVLLGTALAAGCGAESSSSGTSLGLDLLIDRAVADELGAFQVVVLPKGQSRRCAELQRTCLNQQVNPNEALVIQGPDGKKGRALRFNAGLSGGAQELVVDIPVGRDYVVVIEALSRSTPTHFLGSSCNYLESVSATRNEPLIAASITLAASECDPTITP
ncbi:hypothetical protein [Vitiosangium sp. GDMCC 1.1324]|uniref:hypothetical protein n=1 Tax=Vitiosangium sp. (strain GDMCC 1.1324) TaxID=2138576 RepID=UPI000D3998AE|nr:hypothetical protein [Vitiosangium sp. GDMCC 1.1324]PTL82435.1 hypothetical protein DAT35_16605 [Vitiosangium sp. GDMCC 1.1324]